MNKPIDHAPGTTVPVRKPWIRPVVEKIAAGQAEVGTRPSTSDGQFTVS